MTKDFSEREVLNYLQILWNDLEKRDDDSIRSSVNTIGLSDHAKNDSTKKRFQLLLNRNLRTRTSIIPKIIFSVLIIVWIYCSYYFILQTDYAAPSEDVWKNNAVNMANENNSYLEEQEDGSYLFYYEGANVPIPVTKEDVEAGLFSPYPIIKYETGTNWISKILSWFQNN